MNPPSETPELLTGYCAYLVRLWQDSPHAGWRASAQSVQTGATVRFVDLDALFVFLRTQTTTRRTDNERAPSRAAQATSEE